MKHPEISAVTGFNIGCRHYKLVEDKTLLTSDGALAQIDYRKLIIRYMPTSKDLDKAVVLENLAHEFAHGYFQQFNVQMNNEDNCDIFADMMLSFAKNMNVL